MLAGRVGSIVSECRIGMAGCGNKRTKKRFIGLDFLLVDVRVIHAITGTFLSKYEVLS